MEISFRNRVGFLLVSIGKFLCRQGERFLSAERGRYWREAQETLARAEENSIPCPITWTREEEEEFERLNRREQARLAGFDMNQPVCDPTVGPLPNGKPEEDPTEQFLRQYPGWEKRQIYDGPLPLTGDIQDLFVPDSGGVVIQEEEPRFGGSFD